MNKKIVDYKITSKEYVDQYIKNGYQPYGNPFISSEGVFIWQAVVKYEE